MRNQFKTKSLNAWYNYVQREAKKAGKRTIQYSRSQTKIYI